MLNGTEVQPNGEVKITFAIPDDFGKNIGLYAISVDGTSEKIDSSISEDGKKYLQQFQNSEHMLFASSAKKKMIIPTLPTV